MSPIVLVPDVMQEFHHQQKHGANATLARRRLVSVRRRLSSGNAAALGEARRLSEARSEGPPLWACIAAAVKEPNWFGSPY